MAAQSVCGAKHVIALPGMAKRHQDMPHSECRACFLGFRPHNHLATADAIQCLCILVECMIEVRRIEHDAVRGLAYGDAIVCCCDVQCRCTVVCHELIRIHDLPISHDLRGIESHAHHVEHVAGS